MNVIDFCETHPVLFQFVIWPVISGLVVFFFKARTPKQYAALPPRVAGLLLFLSGAGLDPQRALMGLHRVLTGYKPPPRDLTPPVWAETTPPHDSPLEPPQI